MVGRAYNMKEMKLIVDYLTEHRAYSEIRGRKMWMDLANSRSIDRTWQSLKETFLKRILPDIHNPYYKLTVEQIASFRQEHDIEKKNNMNKLEIQTVSEDSSSTDNKIEKAKDRTKSHDENTGEVQCSKIQARNRSSTDTLVLENIDDNAEDGQKDQDVDEDLSAPRSLRDLITYSEPLTPMLQEVIDDFSTDDEPQLTIVEEPETIPAETETNTRKSNSPNPIRETLSFNKKTENKEEQNKTQASKIKSLKLKKTQKGWENKETNVIVTSTVNEKETNNESNNVFTCDNKPKNKSITNEEKNGSVIEINSTNDTQLPNNQEGLENKSNGNNSSIESAVSAEKSKKNKKEKSKKRSRSRSSNESRKKTRKGKNRDVSEPRDEQNTETFNSHPHAVTEIESQGSDPAETKENEVVNLNSEQYQIATTEDTSRDENESIDKNMDVVEDATVIKSNEGTSQEAGPSGIKNGQSNATNVSSDDNVNPCLQSVSLYEEQFSQKKYSDSENEEPSTQTNTSQTIAQIHKETSCENTNEKQNNDNSQDSPLDPKASETDVVSTKGKDKNSCLRDEVLLLKSHSDSDSENFVKPQKKYPAGVVSGSRSKVLANVFGFSSGGTSRRRSINAKSSSRHYPRRGRHSRHLSNMYESGSSDEYSTASDSDDASPSRGHGRRYVKPQPYDVLSHPDGGLFVIGRKKIYPLILKENGSLHYASSRESQDNDGRDSYWKEKYLEERQRLAEEKIRADELARLLKQQTNGNKSHTTRSNSPIIQANHVAVANNNKPKQEVAATEHPQKPEENVKIKFTKDREIELEGQWLHIDPVLERIAKLHSNFVESNKTHNNAISKDAETNAQEKSNESQVINKTKTLDTNTQSASEKANEKDVGTKKVTRKSPKKVEQEKKPEVPVVISSGTSTPVIAKPADPETQKQVDKIENEIFKQIEKIEKSKPSEDDNNVTKRPRGRPKQTSSTSATSLDNTAQKDVSSEEPTEAKEKETTEAIEEKDEATKTQEVPLNEETKTVKLRERFNRASSATKTTAAYESDVSVSSKRSHRAPRRYGSDTGVTPQAKKLKTLSETKADFTIPEDDPTVRYKFPPRPRQNNAKKTSDSYSTNASRITSPDNSSRNSESTQGYQDSDPSPQLTMRRKRKLSTGHRKGQSKATRQSCPYLADDDSCEADQSLKQHSKSVPDSSQNSEVYRSESYAILLNKNKPIMPLDKIDESPSEAAKYTNKKNFDNLTPLTINIDNEYYVPANELRDELSREKSSVGNSSNVSLPLSPELSVVENLSISREIINSLVEHPTLNETGKNQEPANNCTKFLISDMDVSVPLMAQDCALQNPPKKRSLRARKATVSESMLDKIDNVNIVEKSASDSLDIKLRNLLLESAKKMAQIQEENVDKENVMEVDLPPQNEKKTRARKRSSTPRKRKTTSRSKSPNVECVLEEHTESCSRSGRVSCPPVINVVPCEAVTLDDNIVDSAEINNVNTVRGKKKKDVIKVKILRPRSRTSQCNSKLSVCTDSGINDTESVASEHDCKCSDESTELIHNHSDTCLHMDECIGDSVEFIENASTSIISVHSDTSFETRNEADSNFEMQNDLESHLKMSDKIDPNMEMPNETELDFEFLNESMKSSEEFVTPELFCSNAQDATSLKSADSASKHPTQDENVEATPSAMATPATTTYHSPNDSFNSLITDDLSSPEKTPAHSKWHLFSEDTTNFADARSQDVNSNFGSNLNHIFPVTCTVPNLSTITEISKECDSKSPSNVGSPLQAQNLLGFDN